jgi:arginase
MNICALLVPYDSGRLRERMGLGPAHLFEHALKPVASRLGHELRQEEILLDAFTAEIASAFQLASKISQRVRALIAAGTFPVVLSGNCIAALGTITGSGCDVAWFDAHGESMTPDTTTSGFLDGMGIAVLTGQCWKAQAASIPGFQVVPGERVALIGGHDLEPSETELLNRTGVRRDVSRLGDRVYVHLDLDVLDPSEARANQFAVAGGMRIGDVERELLGLGGKVKAVGIASYDPEADVDGRAARAAERFLQAILSNPAR